MNGKFAMVLMGLVALAVVAWLLVDGTQQATPDYESEEPGRDQEPGRERAQDPDQIGRASKRRNPRRYAWDPRLGPLPSTRRCSR